MINQLANKFNLIEELTAEVVNTLAKHYNTTSDIFVANVFVSNSARKAFVSTYCKSLSLLKEV